MKSRLLAAALLAATAIGVAASVDAAKHPSCSTLDDGSEVCYVVVEPGDGWLAVARAIDPSLSGAELTTYAQALEVANGGDGSLTQQLHPGRLLVYLVETSTTSTAPTTSTTATSVAPTTAPPTSTSLPPSSTTTVLVTTSTALPISTSTTSTSSPSTSSSPSTTISTVPPPVPCSNPVNTPGGPDPFGGCWPGPDNTGVPTGVTLTTYTGPCVITTAGTVIDAKTVNCDLVVNAANVTISRSRVNGKITSSSTGLMISDTDIDASPGSLRETSAVDGANFTILRSDIIGGIRGAWCNSCTVQDSYIHGRDVASNWHVGGVRMEQYSTVIHNAIHCDVQPTAQDGGCSADITGYPDFSPMHHWTLDRNLFMANNTGIGFCIYGGGTSGKPYSNNAQNATYIVVRNNVWQRGPNGRCGEYGPVTDYRSGRTGNVWSGNQFDNGATVNPA